ncbi:MAG: hypothetical protein VR64_13830 [Desulfatitalea sp. BRH_c12]|nr:MAG: hypothetical protein VR64_13830 [Desulfatitalea sp. BRH_c12]
MKQIGRYSIRGLLGRGGMAKVFKVELPVIGKIAALKLLAPDPMLGKLMGNAVLQDLFVAEAKTMTGLHHPHIVEIHDFDTHQGNPFYVMDYYADSLGATMGESYRSETPSRTLPADRALSYIRQTLQGLGCLHDAGIVHRDIKPFNLLLTPQDSIKICDFGLSRLRGESFRGPSNLNVGSPYYAAPEQEKDPDKAGPMADIYPLGIMLYRMLTGRLPEYPPHNHRYCPPSRINPDLDAVWDTFIARAAASAPERRFADAHAMLREVDALERHWQAHKENTCRQMPPDAPQHADKLCVGPLRATPFKAPPRLAAQRFGLDALWRPAVYTRNHLEPKTADLIIDRCAGLIWQRGGSRYPLSWTQAQAYVRQLNGQNYADRRNWRLPTVDELITLLQPPPQSRDLCMAAIFDPVQRRLWSCDRRSYVAAYYVDAVLGFVAWQDFTALHYVRAVSTA